MTIETQFNIGQKVYIPELKFWGKVLSIFLNGNGRIQYNIRYFDDKTPKECYFYEEELSKEEEKTTIGFEVK